MSLTSNVVKTDCCIIVEYDIGRYIWELVNASQFLCLTYIKYIVFQASIQTPPLKDADNMYLSI